MTDNKKRLRHISASSTGRQPHRHSSHHQPCAGADHGTLPLLIAESRARLRPGKNSGHSPPARPPSDVRWCIIRRFAIEGLLMRQAANAGFRGGAAWRGVLLNVHRKGDDDEVKLNLTTRGTTQCNMRGVCQVQRGQQQQLPQPLFPSQELPLIQLPRQKMPRLAVTPLALSSFFKHARIPLQLQGTLWSCPESQTASRINERTSHW